MGDTHRNRYVKGENDVCCIKGCEEKIRNQAFCSHHYHNWNRYGHPLGLDISYTRHGQRAKDTISYRRWAGMIKRCHYPKAVNYYNYGGRGIKVCDRWRNSYIAFFEDMGECPEGHSLDRIDNEKGYEPGNCRWATPQEQGRNRRTTVLDMETVIKFRKRKDNGECVAEMAKELGVRANALYHALCGKSWKETA